MYNTWSPKEALGLLGIAVTQRNQYIKCPVCGRIKFMMRTEQGNGKCWECNFRADIISYYAVSRGFSIEDARKDIETRLGITTATPLDQQERKEWIVYKTKKADQAIASDDVLDETYRAFLSMISISAKHYSDMKARCGADPDQLESWLYRTYPMADGITSYFDICKNLLSENKTLEGVPMFYRTKGGSGDYTFIQQTQGIIIPCLNHKREIVALLNRKDDEKRIYRDDLEDYEPKYSWLSSKNKPCGAGAVERIHYACNWQFDTKERCYKPIFKNAFVLTNGYMKADIIHFLMPNLPVIALPDLCHTALLKNELERIKAWGVEGICIAFDMDYKENPNLKKVKEESERLIENAGLKIKPLSWNPSVEGLPEGVSLKGMDDYLAYAKLGIVPTVREIM